MGRTVREIEKKRGSKGKIKDMAGMRRGTCTKNNAQQKSVSLRQSRGAMPHISQSDLCFSSATTGRPDHSWLIMVHFWDLRADHVDRR
jgi:hypothetical protein